MMTVTMDTLKKLSDTLPREEYWGVERIILNAVFEAVQSEDWKGPINKEVDLTVLKVSPEVVKYAVAYYTSTEAVLTDLGGGKYRVTAVGYRAGPAGP